MRIITSNIWGDYFGNEVETREDGLYEVFMKYSPDVIGLQEVTKNWYDSKLFKKLSEDYLFVGTEEFGCKNYVPFVYKKSGGFRLLAKGYELYSDTPDESKGITWGVFEGKSGIFAVCNTHFWWKSGEEHDRIRDKNAYQLTSLMKYLKERFCCPVFAFGDMNTKISSSVFEIYKNNGIFHLYDAAKIRYDRSSHHGDPVRGEDGKYHGRTTAKGHCESIDHIVCLGDNVSVAEYRAIEDECVLDATDHSPVFCDVEF